MSRNPNAANIVTAFRSATLLAGLMVGVGGCSSTLEDGYEPQKLGVSSNQRRAYYASPFTPEARSGQDDRDEELRSRRPAMYQ